jgi:hypothetical protein
MEILYFLGFMTLTIMGSAQDIKNTEYKIL